MNKFKKFLRVLEGDGLAEALIQTKDHLYREYKIFPMPKAIYYERKLGIERSNAIDLLRDDEAPIMFDLLRDLNEGDVFYDIGADKGDYSIKVSDVLQDQNIVAIEPGSGVEILKHRADDKGVDIQILNKAVSNSVGKPYAIRDDGIIVKGGFEGQEGSLTSLSTVDGDEILSSEHINSPPTVIKMDVNGWELDALRAIIPLIEKDVCRLIYIEIEPPDATNTHRHPPLHTLPEDSVARYFEKEWSFDKILKILTTHGFKIEYMMDKSGDLVIKGWR